MVDVEKILEDKAERTEEFTKEEITEKYNRVKTKLDEEHSDKSDGFRERAAVRQTSRWINGVESLEEKEVSVIAKTPKRDIVALARKKAENIFSESPQKAIEDGYTNRQGDPLWRSGRNEGDPMPTHLWTQNAYGVDSEGNYAQITARQDLLDLMETIRPYTKIKGRFNDNSDFGDRVKEYRLSSYSEIEEVEDGISAGPLIEDLKETDAFTDPYDLREIAETIGDYTEVVTLMTLDWFDPEVPEDQNRRAMVSSYTEEITATLWIPNEYEITYGNGTEIYILGTVSLGDIWRDDMEEEPLQLNAHTLIPNPEGTLEEGERLPTV